MYSPRPRPLPGRKAPQQRSRELERQLTPQFKAPVLGSVRPTRQYNYREETLIERNYDEEIEESPIRNFNKACKLIWIREKCPEAIAAVRRIIMDTFSSADGDDIGFGIGETQPDGSPVDSDILDILIPEIIRLQHLVNFKSIAERMLFYGDCFAYYAVDWWGWRLENLKILPTWEVFRVEKYGELVGFEQRSMLVDEAPWRIAPPFMAHWRFDCDYLYGRSLFRGVIDDCFRLEELIQDLTKAARNIGISPLVHTFPCDFDEQAANQYKESLEDFRAQNGTPTDFYMLDGGDVKRLQADSSFPGLLSGIDKLSHRILSQTEIPPWLLYTLYESQAAREISGAPERAYARFINSFRDDIASELYKVCNFILSMNNISPDRWGQYRIVWPQFYIPSVGEVGGNLAESQNTAIKDLD